MEVTVTTGAGLHFPLSLDTSFWLPIGNMKDVPQVRTILQS